ncbi:MAG: DUF2147 domain-containing protein [Comamonadaceae bacterium]|jgi:uncharacterized protein (DUF2147 family)|nr:DUF2147 domain-containing protein [Rhodoferax sp.]TSA06976.1 MAG: DUF2147 domain-containing protein [Comamonadaceae bacterium]
MKSTQFIARGTFFLAALCVSVGVQAQMTPVGNWHTIDDKTGEVKSQIQVTETNGVLSGRVEKLLRKDADQKGLCKECTDDRKDKPMLGLEIIRGAKKLADKDLWEGGKILDPENGKEYTLRMTPIEAGKKLEVRGSIAFFGRTQTWVRVP